MPSSVTRRHAAMLLGGAAALIASPARAIVKRMGPCPIVSPIDAITNRLLDHTPEIATYAGVPASTGGRPMARRMDDYSPEGEEQWRGALGEAGIAIEQIDCSGDPLGQLRLKVAVRESAVMPFRNRRSNEPMKLLPSVNASE